MIRASLADGRVSVSGMTETSGARRVGAQETGTVLFDGQALDHTDGIFVLMHKPAGYACSHDPREAPLIYELLPERWMLRNPRPSSVGRLDRDATGLIIITDQTRLIHSLASPQAAIQKIYIVELDPAGQELDPSLIPLFASGTLRLKPWALSPEPDQKAAHAQKAQPEEEKPCLPAELSIIAPRNARLILREGRYHQVKRMFAACGYRVCALHRESFGPYTLDGLLPGAWRESSAANAE
jgi:16S rRNA pseudouridine516 synthase